MKLIVADSSPLIVLAASKLLPMLAPVADDVLVPASVFAECIIQPDKLGVPEIRQAQQDGHITVRPDVSDDWPDGEFTGLNAGERAAILMARSLVCPVLIDERLGREAARQLGVAVIGSVGVLLEAKRQGVVPTVALYIEQWRQWGYFLSDNLVKAVLDRAGEA